MSKGFRNFIVGFLTVLGATAGVFLEIICPLFDTIRAGLIGGCIGFVVSWTLFFVYHFASFSFISRIDIRVTMSEDNGEKYSENKYSIPKKGNIFLKCEISASANFPRYPFLGKKECFDISMVEIKPKNNLEPCDYSGIFQKAEDKDKTSYKINALANRNKVNIMFKLPRDESAEEKQYRLEIRFKHKILQIFNRTITLYANRPGLPEEHNDA